MNEVPHPPIVSRDRWLDARKKCCTLSGNALAGDSHALRRHVHGELPSETNSPHTVQ